MYSLATKYGEILRLDKCRLVFFLLACPLVIYILGGLFVYNKYSSYYTQYNYLPVASLLDIQLFVMVALLLFMSKMNIKWLFFSFSIIFYLLYCFSSYTMHPIGSVYDFLVINKSFIYFSLLLLIVGSDIKLRKDDVCFIFKLLLVCYLLKYILSRVFFDISRPGLFYENNFELIPILTLWFVLSYFGLLEGRFWALAYFCVILLSGSRSALVSMICIESFLRIRHFDFRTILGIILIFVLTGVAILIFILRLEGKGIESIDRLIFLNIFISEVSSFTALDFFTGAKSITPLSQLSCSKLTFYESLFSDYDSRLCFSVMFHSYFLRTIFDHGIIGVVFVFTLLFRVLKFSDYNTRLSIGLVFVFIINSLSVSSLNSSFAFLSMIILLLFNPKGIYETNKF